VIEAAEAALRPEGFAAQDIPGYANATKCGQATLGRAYRVGTVDTRVLNGTQTPDSFVLLFDAYRFAWFCDGRAAGRLDVGLSDGRWQVTGHGQNTDWELAVEKLEIDFAPDCTAAYLTRSDLGNWTLLTDRNKGVIIYELFSASTVSSTKADFAEHLTKLIGR
jgi:hypothetical protein